MTEEKFWLMNHVPVVIAMDLKKLVSHEFTREFCKLFVRNLDMEISITLIN